LKQFTYDMDIVILIGFKRKDFVSWFKKKYGFGTKKILKERYAFLTRNRKETLDENSYNLN